MRWHLFLKKFWSSSFFIIGRCRCLFLPPSAARHLSLDCSLLVLYKLVKEQLGWLPLLAAMQDNNELDGISKSHLKELQVSGSLLPLPFASRPGLSGLLAFP